MSNERVFMGEKNSEQGYFVSGLILHGTKVLSLMPVTTVCEGSATVNIKCSISPTEYISATTESISIDVPARIIATDDVCRNKGTILRYCRQNIPINMEGVTECIRR